MYKTDNHIYLSRLVLFPYGSFKMNISTQYNICVSDNREDQARQAVAQLEFEVKSFYTVRFLKKLPSPLSKLELRYTAIIVEPFKIIFPFS